MQIIPTKTPHIFVKVQTFTVIIPEIKNKFSRKREGRGGRRSGEVKRTEKELG